MNKIRWSICLVIIFICTPVFGEFYRFLDENGNVTYTDDLSQVPEEQRPKAKTYIESKRILEEKADVSASKKKGTISDSTAELNQIKDRLDQKKKELDKEYKALMKEQAALSEAAKTAKTRAQIQKHNKRVLAFNEKTAEFEKRRKALNNEIRKLNTQIQHDLEEKLKKAEKK